MVRHHGSQTCAPRLVSVPRLEPVLGAEKPVVVVALRVRAQDRPGRPVPRMARRGVWVREGLPDVAEPRGVVPRRQAVEVVVVGGRPRPSVSSMALSTRGVWRRRVGFGGPRAASGRGSGVPRPGASRRQVVDDPGSRSGAGAR